MAVIRISPARCTVDVLIRKLQTLSDQGFSRSTVLIESERGCMHEDIDCLKVDLDRRIVCISPISY